MPAVTAFVGSFFVDEIADHVEGGYYPADMPGVALPFSRALLEGVKTALLTIVVYVVALPFVFFAGIGLVVLFLANAYLLSREYFSSPPCAFARRRKPRRCGARIAARFSSPACLSPPLFPSRS